MPALYFLPLLDQLGPAKPEHLHAAITDWMDRDATGWDHKSNWKPYSISPITVSAGQVGLEISVLNDEAESLLHQGSNAVAAIRLGTRAVRIGELELIHHQPWETMASSGDRVWQLEFLTPTTFRTGDDFTLLPNPAVILRTPSELWHRFAPFSVEKLTYAELAKILVCEIDLQTEYITLKLPTKKGRPEPRAVPALVGSITYRCDDDAAAAKAGALFQLAPYCGIGSFRGKGLGVVRLGSAA